MLKHLLVYVVIPCAWDKPPCERKQQTINSFYLFKKKIPRILKHLCERMRKEHISDIDNVPNECMHCVFIIAFFLCTSILSVCDRTTCCFVFDIVYFWDSLIFWRTSLVSNITAQKVTKSDRAKRERHMTHRPSAEFKMGIFGMEIYFGHNRSIISLFLYS